MGAKRSCLIYLIGFFLTSNPMVQYTELIPLTLVVGEKSHTAKRPINRPGSFVWIPLLPRKRDAPYAFAIALF